jgi:hypothetical protein
MYAVDILKKDAKIMERYLRTFLRLLLVLLWLGTGAGEWDDLVF